MNVSIFHNNKKLIKFRFHHAHDRCSRGKRAAKIQDSIREILYRDWDPIGVCGYGPKDEYDSYIAPVYRVLVGSRSEDELIDILHLTGLENIGVSDDLREQLRLVARKLLTLDVRL